LARPPRGERPRAVAAIDRAIGALETTRRRLSPIGRPTHDYGELWSPGDEAEARQVILNEGDPEVFETAGRRDADHLRQYFGPDEVVLDLGCGIGRVARYVACSCRVLWAVDASARMLEHARHRVADAGNVRFARCTGTTMPTVPDAAVDFAYSLITLQHLEREDAFALLCDLRRVLRPGGGAYLTFPNLLTEPYLQAFLTYVRDGQVTNPARARIYTPQEVERILPAAGFEIAELDAGVEIVAVCR
jgi:ubiquinone/menaquinone biosynthesis C-methylase UbiE